MADQQLPETWEQIDYLAFALIFAANADLEISDKEWEYLDDKLDHKFYEEAQEHYEEWTDYQNAQVLQEGREKYFPGKEGKEQLLDEIQNLFKADEEFNVLEENMLHILHQIL